jgi:hypothetical protein
MSGHIRRRGGRSWELKYEVGTDPRTGKRVTRFQSFKGTAREARAELVRLMETVRRGEHVDPIKLNLTEYLDRWEQGWLALQVGPKTRERYLELLLTFDLTLAVCNYTSCSRFTSPSYTADCRSRD